MPNKVYRIIDANINRAMEGIRVIEDILRFELGNKIITSKLKNLRSDLKKALDSTGISTSQLLKARDSKKDVGADLYTPGEGSRASISEIITSSFKRVEESLRVLEETSKLLNPKFGREFKDIRYRIYDLEKTISILVSRLSSLVSKEKKLNFDLYVIIDPSFSQGRSPVKIAKDIIASGVKIVQLRDKGATKKQYFSYARKIARIAKSAGVTFIINDYADICRAVDADGVHLGQDDLPVAVARSILGEEKIIGVSTHSLSQAIKAERAGADYISVGPVFPTPLKPGKKAVGLKLLRQVLVKTCPPKSREAGRRRIPIVAIGGINESNIYNVRRTGVKRVALIRAVLGADNIKSAVRRLKSR